MNSRRRTIVIAGVSILLVWILVVAGFLIARNSKMTAEKLRAYIESVDLRKLSGEARRKALRDLANKLNALTPEERRLARSEQLWAKWFSEMTEQEKSEFIEATLPSGFKQMLASFEKLPEEKRHKAIDSAVKRMKEARDNGETGVRSRPRGTNAPPPLSPDLQKKVATIGLKSVYSDSSAQTKAELAPLLEEVQKSMETGRMFH